MKIIVTIVPTYLAKFALMFFVSFLTNEKQESAFQQVGDLVTRNISVFYL